MLALKRTSSPARSLLLGCAIAILGTTPAFAATAGPAAAPAKSGPVLAGARASAAAKPADIRAAASSCWYSGGHWWCYNVSGAPVYASDGTVVGYMYSNPSWFICRSDDGGYVGGTHPYRWEWTEADNGAWGWMKDTAIYSETDPLPVC